MHVGNDCMDMKFHESKVQKKGLFIQKLRRYSSRFSEFCNPSLVLNR
jgi:hypothetical protein